MKRASTGGTFVCKVARDTAFYSNDTEAEAIAVRADCGPGYYYSRGVFESLGAGPGGLLRSGSIQSPDGYNN